MYICIYIHVCIHMCVYTVISTYVFRVRQIESQPKSLQTFVVALNDGIHNGLIDSGGQYDSDISPYGGLFAHRREPGKIIIIDPT